MIWSYRFLPISDYPDWIFEGSIVAKLLRGQALASYSFKHYPVPYSGTVAMLGLLDLILAPEISGKIVLSLCVILLALSSTYLLRSLRRDADNPLLLIPLLFLLNTFFFWGELGYLFSLSILFLYCGYLFRRLYRSEPINWWLVASASIAMFLFHFVPYATAVLVTLTLILVESRTDLLGSLAISFAPSHRTLTLVRSWALLAKADAYTLDVLDPASTCRPLARRFLVVSGISAVAWNSSALDEDLCDTQSGRGDRSNFGDTALHSVEDPNPHKIRRSTGIRSSLRNCRHRHRL